MEESLVGQAADYAIKDRAALVGGAAVDLHTGSCRPTDIDMCAYFDESDRSALVELGFRPQGDHFSFESVDEEIWPLEFPALGLNNAYLRIVRHAQELISDLD